MASVKVPIGGEMTEENLVSTLVWGIENISDWDPEFCAGIQSPIFDFYNTSGCELYLCHKGEKDENKKFACRLRFHKKKCSLDYEWSLMDGDGSPVVKRMVQNATMEPYQYVDFLDWPTYEDVFRAKKSSFLTNDTLILRCRFWNSEKDFEKAEYISGYTRIETADTSFLWRIKKFSSLQLEQELVAPFVMRFSKERVNFKLKVSLKGHSITDAITNFEIISEDNNVWQRLITTLSILDDKKRTMKSLKNKSNVKISYQPSEQVSRLPKFFSRQEVINGESDWLHDGDLTLLCEFQSVKNELEHRIGKIYIGYENLKTEIPRNIPSVIKNAIRETIVTDPTSTKPAVPEESKQTPPQCSDSSKIPQHITKSTACLQEDLLSMYRDHSLSDFELRSGDASIRVHKIFLMARSPVFKAMFRGEMKEASSDFLDVPDLDIHTLNRMLTFMYTGTVDQLDWESAAKLYYAADKYQVQTLKKECLHLLQSGINVQNVSDILELADRHQDKDLELFIHDFLIMHFDEVILSEEWEKFLNRKSTLGGTTMREVYKKKLQKDCK